jgi:hypothetical protein
VNDYDESRFYINNVLAVLVAAVAAVSEEGLVVVVRMILKYRDYAARTIC